MDTKNQQNQNNRPNQRAGFQPNRGGFNQRGGFNPRGSRQERPREESEFFEKVVQVNRVSKKTKGGDIRSLSVLVVAGDKKGKVGVGLGKARDVQSAVRKATLAAKKYMIQVPLKEERTIPHDVFVKLGAAKVLLKPAPEGTGVIAGGAVRVVVEAAGIKDVVSKTLGTSNRASNVYATLEALKGLKSARTVKVVDKKETSEKEVKLEKKETKKKGAKKS
jgi:small subunit ribosomal protein S5